MADIRYAQTAFEVRKAAAAPVIRGYAAVIGSVSEDMGFREIIEPGAFDGVLGNDVRALWNHNPEKVLGRTASGTLKIWADERGLGYEATPPDAQWASEGGNKTRVSLWTCQASTASRPRATWSGPRSTMSRS